MKYPLAGVWKLSCDRPGFSPIDAQIPGDNATALLSSGLAEDPNIGLNEAKIQWIGEHVWTWTRTVELAPEFLSQRRIWLTAESLDTAAEVWINGHLAGTSENMFLRFRAEVKPLLQEGVNTVKIVIRRANDLIAEKQKEYHFKDVSDDPSHKISGLTMIRKIQCQGGWDWGLCVPLSGIYGEIALEGSDGVRLEHVYTEQKHSENRCRLGVVLELDAKFKTRKSITFRFSDQSITRTFSLSRGFNSVAVDFTVDNPTLWYPVGCGEQPLYKLTVDCDDVHVVKRIGLRKLEVDCKPDKDGVPLSIKVNGVAVFCKGANWIPMDSRPQTYTRERYRRLVADAVEANMNMLRVWGGGLYENDDFYDLCDEMGVLVWQDLMFACMAFPQSDAFRRLTAREAEYQTKRLRDHVSIALWCGDNECTCFWGWAELKRYDWMVGWDRSNYSLGEAVRRGDPTRMFWPSSPCGGPDHLDAAETAELGDMHYWGVWHGGKGIEAYYEIKTRFCSEFGYQSFPCQDTVDFMIAGTPRNVTSPVMESHQRNGSGNSKIVEMFTRYFRLPTHFEDFIYLSQAQQALAMKKGVEFWRSLKPYCMGTLYWQLNDNWPVASWSSIDYFGRWKQLHYQAKRFYSPVIATIAPTGKNVAAKWELRVVSDVNCSLGGTLNLTVRDFCGNVVRSFDYDLKLDANASEQVAAFSLADLAETPETVFLTLDLQVAGEGRNYSHFNDCFLTPYKRCDLPRAEVSGRIVRDGDGVAHLLLRTERPAFFVFAEFRGIPAVLSDNSVTLLPGKTLDLVIRTENDYSNSDLENALVLHDLQSCYES